MSQGPAVPLYVVIVSVVCYKYRFADFDVPIGIGWWLDCIFWSGNRFEQKIDRKTLFRSWKRVWRYRNHEGQREKKEWLLKSLIANWNNDTKTFSLNVHSPLSLIRIAQSRTRRNTTNNILARSHPISLSLCVSQSLNRIRIVQSIQSTSNISSTKNDQST